jgi:signal transduction histidine kinase
MEMCLECEPFIANMDTDSMEETLKVVDRQFTNFREMVNERDRELESTSMELALGLSEVFEALKEVSSGDPSVRIPETSELDLIAKLKHIVNMTAENQAEIVNLSHEFAIGLAEHFDVLHKVSEGNLTARVSGTSEVELLESLKKVTNQMIESVSREITERKRAEEALQSARDDMEILVEQRTAELSKSNALLKQEIAERKQAEKECRNINVELNNFVRVVSHDLKTPIIAIQGFSSRLLKHYEEKLGKRGGRYVEQIKASARRMEVLVFDLLELSKIGRVVSAFKDVSSLEIVRNVTSALGDRLKENEIELVVTDNLPTICCDGERMYQVFENLLVNAIKFTRVTKAPKIEIGYEDRGNFHQFYVRDNGVGIDPKYHRKVFEMFRRLKQIEDQEGTGLGLAIVDRIVKNHNGKVWVESEKGKGATFHLTLQKAP